MRSSIWRIASLLAVLLFSGCVTTMATVEKYQEARNYRSLIRCLSEYVSGNAEGERMQASAREFLLSHKDEAKPYVIEALADGRGDIREGAAELVDSWIDPDFIDPLFAALSDTEVVTRQTAAYSMAEQGKVLPSEDVESLALRLAEAMRSESEVYVLNAYASTLATFAVKSTNGPLKEIYEAIFVNKTKKLTDFSGTGAVVILLEKKLAMAIRVTE